MKNLKEIVYCRTRCQIDEHIGQQLVWLVYEQTWEKIYNRVWQQLSLNVWEQVLIYEKP